MLDILHADKRSGKASKSVAKRLSRGAQRQTRLQVSPRKRISEDDSSSKKKRHRSGTPVSTGDALRREGVDERRLAQGLANLFGNLQGKIEENEKEKLFVDVLKECSRHLESTSACRKAASGETPVIVELVHKVPRPARQMSPQGLVAPDGAQ